MLSALYIRDFALIQALQLEFQDGMTIITGETGAGKSIIIDALGFILGARTDAGFVRHGAEKTDLSAEFDIRHNTAAQAWLSAHDLEDEGCLLRRVITQDGRSKAYINGRPSPLQQVRELGEQLVDIHGQHAHQHLLKESHQRQLLDGYGQNQALCDQVKQAYHSWQHSYQRLEQLQQQQEDIQQRLDYLRFQVTELDDLGLSDDEWESISQEQQTLAHSGQILQQGQQALQQLDGDEHGNACHALNSSLNSLQGLPIPPSQLDEITDLLNQALIQASEASSALSSYLNQVNLDPSRLDWLEQRMAEIHALARKHRQAPEDLAAYHQQLQQELQDLESNDEQLAQAQQQLSVAHEQYLVLAQQLRQQRQHAGESLAQHIANSMQELGMEGGRFAIQLQPLADEQGKAHGLDKIEFMVSANPGQPLQALRKVASGGELARISLAIDVITTANVKVPTLIFDEVDTGIGGPTAAVVGRLLRQLGEDLQVLCVTHLPQVAACGHQHYHVAKTKQTDTTHTHVQQLSAERRTEELARMLGGLDINQRTLEHAQDLLKQANQ